MKALIASSKQHKHVLGILVFVAISGAALMVSSTLMRTESALPSVERGMGYLHEDKDGSVVVNVYQVDPDRSDFKGELLHTEVTRPQQHLKFLAPEGIEPPYVLEFQTLEASGLTRARMTN